MTTPRLFLAAPADIADDLLLSCATAAARAGDCASVLVGEKIAAPTVAALQGQGLAVIIRDCEPRQVHYLKADGIHIARAQPVKTLRATLKSESIGVFAATSRHIAMEAAEAGADYVAFAQGSQAHGEPLIGWWQDIFEVPAVAFDLSMRPDLPHFCRRGRTLSGPWTRCGRAPTMQPVWSPTWRRPWHDAISLDGDCARPDRGPVSDASNPACAGGHACRGAGAVSGEEIQGCLHGGEAAGRGRRCRSHDAARHALPQR